MVTTVQCKVCLIFSVLVITCEAVILQTNMLLIMFDDLRPELSVYDRKHMITPNFDRLAQRSVIFDQAYAQIAVCNPSRTSLLTGLRPDTTGCYNFQTPHSSHLILPTYLARSGYNTAGIGKILHIETDDKNVWNFEAWENGWYEYQSKESGIMNSSVMPDGSTPEEHFRDYQFTTKAIETLRKLVSTSTVDTVVSVTDANEPADQAAPKPFFLAVGFKLPHLSLHIPHYYYSLYKQKAAYWELSKKELRYPQSSPEVAYRCCAQDTFQFMEAEGSKPSRRTMTIGDINRPFGDKARDELMMGYCGAITFMDKQLGRLLDTLDELELWQNLTVVLTADHGMHNGEKGIWEKWSMFDEATRVPLFIAHPLSPHKGQHYTAPVELLDVFPTVLDLLQAPSNYSDVCVGNTICHPLQGNSLARIVLGDEQFESLRHRSGLKETATRWNANMTTKPAPRDAFAITQTWRCANKKDITTILEPFNNSTNVKATRRQIWADCDKFKAAGSDPDEVCLIGYSMRTANFRYTAWLHYSRVSCAPMLEQLPMYQELYDHRQETLRDFTHRETTNLANKKGFHQTAQLHHSKLVHFIRNNVLFKGC